ncbi:MAG: DNA mismatch repair endonuclease MutL [Cyanobacteria bacterium P01_H01_bin.74]
MIATEQSKIQVLPAHLVNRIAAGEVIERPASVVKELLENAIDAGATRVEIIISNAGRNCRIADNGYGMTPENAALAFLNHATSKIKAADDLDNITTLGFRGEALASIAAISHLTCQTRTQEAHQGTQVSVKPSGETVLTDVGCAVGTIMTVEDLFYNTPARLKFLKRPQTELAHIEETVQLLALANPAVQIHLIINDKTVLNTAGATDLKSVLDIVYKRNQQDLPLIPVAYDDASFGFFVTGFVSAPGIMKSSRRWMVNFVNNRAVKCLVLQKATEVAYESLLPHGRYPFSVLFLILPPTQVDINVHPAKREVRYAEANTIFSFVKAGIREALIAAGTQILDPSPTGQAPLNREQDSPPDHLTVSPEALKSTEFASQPQGLLPARFSSAGHSSFQQGYGYSKDAAAVHDVQADAVQGALALYEPAQQPGPLSAHSDTEPVPAETLNQQENSVKTQPFKVLNQLFNTYILLETPQGLMVVDQHIASERMIFEQLSRNFSAETPAIQHLIASVPLLLSPTQQDLLTQYQPQFAKLGFLYTIEKSRVSLCGVPLVFVGRDKMFTHGGLFENLIAQLEETGSMALDTDLLIATLACHAAVRAGDLLSQEAMTQVITGWLDSVLPWTCPHGRPIAHTISVRELNHFFDRPSLPVNAF